MNKASFVIRTSFRDARKNVRKLLLFMSSIVLGIAALVAINTFNHNLKDQIDAEAASLLGADLAVTGNLPFESGLMSVFDSLPGEKAAEMELMSMAYLPKSDETRFIRLKALKGNYPFYGKIQSVPEGAVTSFRTGPEALVEESLMLQYQLEPGDTIKIGKMSFPIAGRMTGGVGSVGISSAVAPTVYISMDYIDSTELVQPGSLVNYAYYYSVPGTFDLTKWKESKKSVLSMKSYRVETIEDRKNNLNRAFSYLNHFLNLVAIVALLLGCLGVASSVWIYADSKLRDIALLRCLGVSGRMSFMIYFIQILLMSVIGSIAGVSLGMAVQSLIPALLKDFLPVSVETAFSGTAVFQGFTIGLTVSMLFALIPLLSLRNISPLQTLRQSYESDSAKKDKSEYIVQSAIFLSLVLITGWLTGSLLTGFVFTLGIGISWLLLRVLSGMLTRVIRFSVPAKLNFSIRHGLSNLFRPDNQTNTIIVTLGMGTAILASLIIIQSLLLNNVSLMDEGNQPNMIIYGIESNQKDSVRDLTVNYKLPVMQEVPIVTMRIEGWKGRSKSQWLSDSTMNAEKWAVNRETRVTYRDTLSDGETLLDGILKPYIQGDDSIYISLGNTYADALGVELGDEITFNVQGSIIKTYVGSLREIDFRNMSTRFFVVFPSGILEAAPQFHVLVTKTPDTETMTAYRTMLIRSFPNVSAVDLTTILQTVNTIIKKVSFVIRFMALFSLLTGFIILIGALSLSKYRRLKENVLLRTIGATKIQLLSIYCTEYAILGFIAASTGLLLAITASFLISKFQFQLDYALDWSSVLTLLLFIPLITVVMGLINSRSVLNSTPLEVLRKETL